jgi:hypothetical protein
MAGLRGVRAGMKVAPAKAPTSANRKTSLLLDSLRQHGSNSRNTVLAGSDVLKGEMPFAVAPESIEP